MQLLSEADVNDASTQANASAKSSALVAAVKAWSTMSAPRIDETVEKVSDHNCLDRLASTFDRKNTH